MSADTNRSYREWLDDALALDQERWEELEGELARLRRVPRRTLLGRLRIEDSEEHAKAA